MTRPLIILDTETTGLDPLRVVPIEVAMIYVRPDASGELVEVDRVVTLVPAPPVDEWEPGALAMHDASGLRRQVDHCRPEHEVGAQIGSLSPERYAEARALAEARLTLTRHRLGVDLGEWVERVAARADPQAKEPQATACGANVGRFDLTILLRTMPALARRFHYRTLDVSAIKVAASMFGWASEPERPKTHRALEDCRATLADLNYYRRALQRGGLSNG